MDFLASFFQSAAGIWKRRAAAREEARAVFLEDHLEAVSLLARAAAGGKLLELRPGKGGALLQDDTLVLPASMAFFPTPHFNRFALLHQALLGGALRAVLSPLSLSSAKDAPDRAFAHLREEFPSYARWREEGLRAIRRELGPGGHTVFDSTTRVEWIPAHAPIERSLEGTASRQRGGKGSEREAPRPLKLEAVDLEKERDSQNPVMHAFEKLETADEYRGGHRVTDASDELAGHSDALEELSLSKVTRSGEAASSLYRAEVNGLFESRESPLSSPGHERFLLYPEWDFRAGRLQPRHCRLHIRSSESASACSDIGTTWKASLRSDHSAELLGWERRWLSVMNRRAWEERQRDGEEIGIDAYVRYLSDLRSCGAGDGRIFSRRSRPARDFSALFLMDESYSTDSYVEGQRVLDVERDSLGLAGFLLEGLPDPVAVAGTWSETRSRCHFQWHKGFSEPWDAFFRRAPQIRPQGYTRLGPAIRHATEALLGMGSRTKLLILLTDGKPTDFDRYEGRYGIEDIRHAILEAEQRGVVVKALTVEKDAKHYFPTLFGPRNYRILSNPRQCPEALFRLYLEASRI